MEQEPAPAPVEPAPAPTFSIGDTGPGGGIVFEVSADGTSGLEVAPDVLVGFTYGCVGVDVTETTQVDLSDAPGGLDTVGLLVNAGCISPAADAAAAYSADNGTNTDWYLPSANELVTIREQGRLPGLPGTSYWSATDDSTLNAFLVQVVDTNNPLFDPAPSTTGKETVASVLPVRSF